jgi:phosphohistidine phosphatase
MKLYFLRHGRADRSAWGGDDFNRPLTPRGIEITEAAAEMMNKLDLGLDLILTSPLVRALQTAEVVAAGLNIMDRLLVDDRISPGFNRADLALIFDEHPDAESIMLVGHEPDFSRTIESIIGGGAVVCKKGSLARVDLTGAGELSGELVWLIPPKALTLYSSRVVSQR